MNLIDIHSHLNHNYFKDKLEQTLKNAEEAGVKVIIVSGTNSTSNKEVLEFAKKSPLIKVSLGLHPIDALGLFEDDGDFGLPKQDNPINLEEEFKFMEENKDNIVAIGEVGLDFHWDKDNHQKQIENFRKIIQFADRIKKPIVVHTWDAEEEVLNILEEESPKVPVILHCFGGRKALITRAKELGYYFSVPPSIVRIGNFQTLVKKVPLTQLFTETDAPWQSPYKGKKNEPAFVMETIKKIAHIKKITEEEVAEQIWKNYQKIFA